MGDIGTSENRNPIAVINHLRVQCCSTEKKMLIDRDNKRKLLTDTNFKQIK